MSPRAKGLLHTVAIVAAGIMACAPALADGNGHARGGGSFSSRGGGSHASHSGGRSYGGGHSSGSRSYSGSRGHVSSSRGSVSSGRSYGSSNRGSYGGSRGSYTTRGGNSSSSVNRGSVNRGGFSSSDRSASNTMRAPRGMTGNVARTPPASTVRDGSSSSRGNPRPGFNTTRPDFGTGGMDRRPNLSTRPDFNSRSTIDRGGRSNFSGRVANDRDGNRRGNFSSRDSSRDWNRDGRRFNHRPGFDGHRHGGSWHHGRHHWHGGYWNGRFWPRVYYRPNFVSFWPVLPATYSTFWFGGVSYYYVDDLYYTWSPARYGYVVTDPPPVVEAAGSAEAESTAAEAVEEVDESGAASVYVYPRNGQSEEQTANDRFECHQWAVSQTGFDPTTANGADPSVAGSAADYRRALIACLDARGYSAN